MMKEVIIKKLLFWMVLIVGIVALIGSCAKKDDSTAATATALTAPSDVTATLGWHQVAVDWTAVSGASSYTVYWGSSTGITSSSTAITGITDDNYTHTGLDNGTTYFYKVATVNSAGTGSLSSEYSATPRAAYTVAEACTAVSLTETPGGTWAGMKDDNITSGKFFSLYRSEFKECIDNSAYITDPNVAAHLPSDTIGVSTIITMTSNTSFTKANHWYAGDNCTKETGFFATGYDNVSFGDNITIAGQPCTNCSTTQVPYATKVTYTEEQYCLLAENEAASSFHLSEMTATVAVGTPLAVAAEGAAKAAIMVNLDNVTGATTYTNTFFTFFSHDNSTAPDNWTTATNSADVMFSMDNVSNQ
jgi:hypothetical protein